MSDRTRRCHPWSINSYLVILTQMILMLIILHGGNDVASAVNQTVYFVSQKDVNSMQKYAEGVCGYKGGQLLNFDYPLVGVSMIEELQQYVERKNFTDIRYNDKTFFLDTDCIVPFTQMKWYDKLSIIRYFNDTFQLHVEYSNAETWNWHPVNIGKLICQIKLPEVCSFIKTTKLVYKECVNINLFETKQHLYSEPCSISFMTTDETSTSTDMDLATERTNPAVLSTGDIEQSSMFSVTNTESTSPRTVDEERTIPDTRPPAWTQTNEVSQTATSVSEYTRGVSVESSEATVTSYTDQQTRPTDEQKVCRKRNTESQEEKAKFTEEILAKVTIDTKKTRANVARYISAIDDRPSAQTVGWVGALFLCLVLSLSVLFDLFNLIMYISKVREKRKRKRKQKRRVNGMEMKITTVKSSDVHV